MSRVFKDSHLSECVRASHAVCGWVPRREAVAIGTAVDCILRMRQDMRHHLAVKRSIIGKGEKQGEQSFSRMLSDDPTGMRSLILRVHQSSISLVHS